MLYLVFIRVRKIRIALVRWQSGRMRLTRNQLYVLSRTWGSNPYLTAKIIDKHLFYHNNFC